ncbi:hypothetical protein [Novosphingobium sp. Fuku2-ISO-50]|jgi:hypothetical protein|uniref:hypothetical protein n=1 Tax=Novosphingobium sp. Fuku2-ISO-50 TaxID=1739114 RepID=UPI000A4B9968|nr:hypothetical protein [Novosphingobium sp. Fuku2-ISO-50]
MTAQPAPSLTRLPLALLLCATAPAIATAQVTSLNAADKPAGEKPAIMSVAPKGEGPTAAQAPAGAVGGMGDINLYPKRVVIDDRNRVASVGVYNKTANTGDYDITIADMMMSADGRLVEPASVKDGDPTRARLKGASEMVRWSPHRFTLPGNESQMVRLMARVSPDLPAGEYRTHFSVIAVPPGDDGLTIDEAANGKQTATGIGVKITPRFGISIPVIIRVGETTLTSGLKDFAVNSTPEGQKLVRITITRSGTRSSFGDIAITAPGAPKPVAAIKGVGVYTEVDERTITVPVDPSLDARFTASGTHLTVTYTDDDYAPGQTLAKQDFVVP